jgi:polysaccharide export outer membrane protein
MQQFVSYGGFFAAPPTKGTEMSGPRKFQGAMVSLLLACFSGCGSTHPPPDGALARRDDAEQYLIGPGDTLQVFVWRSPDLSVTVPVRPDGRISTPLVENMKAVGKTPSQLARDMEAVLQEYVRSPKVNIIITVAVSTLSQVSVVGQVKKPRALPYREGMTVLDVILAVDGLSEFAAGNRSKIVRSEGGTTRKIRVKLDDLLNKGDVSQNFPVRPGDVLVVPQSLL